LRRGSSVRLERLSASSATRGRSSERGRECLKPASRPLPLWSAAARLAAETLRRSGTDLETGNSLPRIFQEAGLPSPVVQVDRLIGAELWLPDCLQSLRSRMTQFGLSLEPLADFDTLHERLDGEVSSFKARVPLPSIVSAWSRTSTSSSPEQLAAPSRVENRSL